MTTVAFRTPILLAVLAAAGLGCGDGFMTVDTTADPEVPSFQTPETSPNTSGQQTQTPTGPLQCGVTEAFCQGACLDISSNPQHCGGCGIVCEGGTCQGGACSGGSGETTDTPTETDTPDEPMSCNAGEMLCGMECVDTSQSNQHCGACDNACVGGMACVNGSCATVTEIEGVWMETNAARAAGADCGAYGQYAPTTPLELDPDLNEAAQAHALDMSANNFFSHTGSDGSSFVVRIQRTDFSGQPIGENIAAGQQSPAQAVSGWVDSDGHCRNLMNPQATKIGIGYTTGGPYGTLWVQVFGR